MTVVSGGLLDQIARFGIVGVIATALDYLLLIAFHEVAGLTVALSAALSFSLSTVFNYAASMRYVFRQREDLSRSRGLLTFCVLSLIGLGVNELIMMAGELACGALGIPYESGFAYVIVKVFATAVVMVWNFLSRKIFLEQR